MHIAHARALIAIHSATCIHMYSWISDHGQSSPMHCTCTSHVHHMYMYMYVAVSSILCLYYQYITNRQRQE